MRRGWPAMVALALAAGCSSTPSAGPAAPAPLPPVTLAACPAGLSPELPDVVLACIGGGPAVHVASAGPGVPTVVNLWATWCPPCRDETPLLVAFHRRAGGRVRLVGIASEDTARTVLAFSHDFGTDWAQLLDAPGTVFRRYAGGPPVTLFLAADGRLVGRHVGVLRSQAQLAGLVRRYLGVAA